MAAVNVYELVKQVLDETYEELGGSEAERDERIKAALARLSSAYGALTVKSGPAYGDAATRFAYIFCYVTAHANLVCRLLNAPAVQELFRRDTVVASCIGGGPGSDVVGIIKRLFAMYGDQEKTPRVQVYLCDREKRWMDSWADVGMKLPGSISLSTAAFEVDVTDPASWDMKKYLKADLFTLSYFLSEVYTLRAKVTPFFDAMFRDAKPGAIFAFVDNNDDTFLGWFDEMVGRAELEVLHSDRGARQMPCDEQQNVLDQYMTKFSRQTKLKTWVGERIVRKPQ